MPIKKLTPPANIDKFIEGEIENLKNALINKLCYIGEQALNNARISGSYVDQTGNLRSSVGYVVAVDGEVVQMSSFDVIKEGGNGAKVGKDYALSIVQKFPRGIVLIVVAGMNYASYVSAKGYDVLESSELLAEKLIPQMLGQLGFK